MKLHHLAIQVHDLEGAVRWYSELFGWPVLREWPAEAGGLRAVWLALSPVQAPSGLSDDSACAFVALERCERAPQPDLWRHPNPGLHVLALRIAASERATWVARLAARGVSLDHSSAWSIYFRDPEGNRLALSHHPDVQPGLPAD